MPLVMSIPGLAAMRAVTRTPRFAPALAALALLALTGCQMSLPFGKGEAPPPAASESAITGAAIATTRLEPSREAAGAGMQAGAKAASAAATAPSGATPGGATPGTAAAPTAEGAAPADTASGTAAATDAAVPPVPPVVKSAAQMACEKSGGKWAAVAGKATRSCVKTLRDGGKRCTAKTDCQGECLARSNSCSPIAPLFGCNEVLGPNGVRETQCLN